jgi:hypothetical protein
MKTVIFKFISTLVIIMLISLNIFAKDNKVKKLENRVIQESQKNVYKLKNILKKHYKKRKKNRKKKRKHMKKIIVKPFHP